MSVVKFEVQNNIGVITMDNGENRQDIPFAEGMLAALDAAEADKSVRAVVITSSDAKNWSQGINLNFLMKAMQDGEHDEVRRFMYGMNEVFTRLLLAPFPVIAAINGHAFGNGAMLACACDFRVMRSDRGYFCFPEVDISIPFLPGMIEFVKKAMPYYRFNELKLTGRRAAAADLLADHVIEAAYPDAASTFEGAMELAATFNKGRAIFGEHKRRLHHKIVDVIATEDKPYIDELKLTI